MKEFISPAMAAFLSTRGHGYEEIIDWSFYDFYTGPGLRDFELYQMRYAPDPGRYDPQVSNMDYPGSLSKGKRFGLFSFDFKLAYHDEHRRPIGSCPKCGAPLTGATICEYCYVKLPVWALGDGSIHGYYEISVLNKTYVTGKLNGPIHARELRVPIPIPEHCCFKVSLHLDREVNRIASNLHGLLIRATQ